MGASRAGYRSAESWWRQGLVGLADLVKALEANPQAERVVMPAETLVELEAEAAETWRRVPAWCRTLFYRKGGPPTRVRPIVFFRFWS